MKRTDLVIEIVSALIKAAQCCGCRFSEKCSINRPDAALSGHRTAHIQSIQATAGISVGQFNQDAACFRIQCEFAELPSHGAVDQLPGFFFGKAFELIDRGSRQQCINHFKGRILRCGAHKDKKSRLHVRQESILLALAEAMHLVNKYNGWALRCSQRLLSSIDRLTNVLYASQNSRYSDKRQIKSIRH